MTHHFHFIDTDIKIQRRDLTCSRVDAMYTVELFLEPEIWVWLWCLWLLKKMLSNYTSDTGIHFYCERLNNKDIFVVKCKSVLFNSILFPRVNNWHNILGFTNLSYPLKGDFSSFTFIVILETYGLVSFTLFYVLFL